MIFIEYVMSQSLSSTNMMDGCPASTVIVAV